MGEFSFWKGSPGDIGIANRLAAAKSSLAFGVNASGRIVGEYDDGTGADFGFVYRGGTYTTLKLGTVGYDGTVARGINASGHVVGSYVEKRSPYKQRAFLYINGLYAIFAHPSADYFTKAEGINAAGHIVGTYGGNIPGGDKGFLYINGLWASPIDYPSALQTAAIGINDNGQIVGAYLDGGRYFHGYLLDEGTYRSIDFPSAVYTIATAINNSGHVVGHYVASGGDTHGYLLKMALTRPSTSRRASAPWRWGSMTTARSSGVITRTVDTTSTSTLVGTLILQ